MQLPVIPGQLPIGFCPTDFQTILNGFSAAQSVSIGPASSATSVVVSSTKPTDQTALWLRLDQFGRPERVYWFASGAWLSLHPLVPGLTQWWFDTAPDFTTFDGGDALALSAISGPTWRLAKNSDGVVIAAKFPIAAGTLPSGVVLAQGTTGGEENHVLTLEEIPPHTHSFPIYAGDATNHDNRINTTDELTVQNPSFLTGSTGGDPASGTPPTVAKGHNNLPNYVVGFLLQRTARIFYAIT